LVCGNALICEASFTCSIENVERFLVSWLRGVRAAGVRDKNYGTVGIVRFVLGIGVRITVGIYVFSDVALATSSGVIFFCSATAAAQ
jgi:hypothetical protein